MLDINHCSFRPSLPYAGQIGIELYREVLGATEACHFVIRNNGPCIPAATLPHLFARFFQVDIPQRQADELPAVSADDIARGFGLGLGIYRRIVEMHQGKIRAFNPVSGGVAFEIIIPIRQPDA